MEEGKRLINKTTQIIIMDYKKLNFKCVIECHQQIDSHKLFCSCPSITNKKENPDLIIKRKLRAVAGESGKKDIAALYEESKNKIFVYEFYNDYDCLVDIDSEPPHEINKEALDIAIQISLLLKAKIQPKLKIMRKIVVDGSNTTGFQRTALLATDGKIKTSKGIVKIPTIFLEEEAAKKIKIDKNEVIYRLDRLGIPLVEIATDSSIKDPEHAKETASIIGLILRSTKVRRGLGTIRQDVNLSIKNSPRIEIKGFQELKSIPKIINYEIQRLIKEKPKSGEVRKAEPDLTTSFLRPLPGKARIYPETDIPEIRLDKKLISKIRLPELITEKSIKLEKSFNLKPELAKEIIKQKINFSNLVKKYPCISPKFIAYILIETPKEIKTRFKIKKELKKSDFEFIFSALNQNKIIKEAVINLALDLLKNKKPSLDNYKPLKEKEIEKEIEKIIAKNPGASLNALMGIAMSKFKSKIEGKRLIEIIKKYI